MNQVNNKLKEAITAARSCFFLFLLRRWTEVERRAKVNAGFPCPASFPRTNTRLCYCLAIVMVGRNYHNLWYELRVESFNNRSLDAWSIQILADQHSDSHRARVLYSRVQCQIPLSLYFYLGVSKNDNKFSFSWIESALKFVIWKICNRKSCHRTDHSATSLWFSQTRLIKIFCN